MLESLRADKRPEDRTAIENLILDRTEGAKTDADKEEARIVSQNLASEDIKSDFTLFGGLSGVSSILEKNRARAKEKNEKLKAERLAREEAKRLKDEDRLRKEEESAQRRAQARVNLHTSNTQSLELTNYSNNLSISEAQLPPVTDHHALHACR